MLIPMLLSFHVAAAAAEAQGCRVALALALDVSSSVDSAEYRLQIEGVAHALLDREVQAAILQSGGSIALQVFEWSGENDQVVIQDWMLIDSTADLEAFAAGLLRQRETRSFLGNQTAIGAALDFALTQLERGPTCWESKIDVSGDGQTNEGIRPQDLYWMRDFGDIVVNGLAIEASVTGLLRYYDEFVIRGPNAFVIRAADYDDFSRAMREKLIRELGAPRIGALDGDAAERPAPPFR
ncbi:DUF1194 domain-containing protein [Roseitranquillus sediminis]|uniref:DUF1194 domain-containing protein n=1 Tax=Roseitranquillus sediminis TaxID=2809051 RepID=UPI001D0BFFC7|nr:DUF1194 domain-containing protein [Roseitranquillus sediminis]